MPVAGLTGNELVFENVFMGSSNASTTFTPGSGQTQLWLVNGYASSSSFNSMGAASTEQASGSTVTMSWTTTTGLGGRSPPCLSGRRPADPPTTSTSR